METATTETKPICRRCHKEFMPYPMDEECYSCDGGAYESYLFDYGQGPDIIDCPFCGGSGSIDWIESVTCRDCKEIEYWEAESD